MIEIPKYVQPKTVFDLEFIQVLASAFDDAWNRIELSGSRFARPGYARATREVIAKRIIETAQRRKAPSLTMQCSFLKPITRIILQPS